MNESDRELLELAAKACGINGEYGVAFDDFYYQGNTQGLITELPDGQSYVWNPLEDDGDAFKLLVKLKIDLFNYYPPFAERRYVDAVHHMGGDYGSAQENIDDDPAKSVRLAIVKCAADIGKKMEANLK